MLDSRPSPRGDTIRRRRRCDKCGTRFSTVEARVADPAIREQRVKAFRVAIDALLGEVIGEYT